MCSSFQSRWWSKPTTCLICCFLFFYGCWYRCWYRGWLTCKRSRPRLPTFQWNLTFLDSQRHFFNRKEHGIKASRNALSTKLWAVNGLMEDQKLLAQTLLFRLSLLLHLSCPRLPFFNTPRSEFFSAGLRDSCLLLILSPMEMDWYGGFPLLNYYLNRSTSVVTIQRKIPWLSTTQLVGCHIPNRQELQQSGPLPHKVAWWLNHSQGE